MCYCCCQTPPPTHNGTCILSLYSLPYLSSHLRFLLLIVFVFFFNSTHAASNGGRASQSNLLLLLLLFSADHVFFLFPPPSLNWSFRVSPVAAAIHSIHRPLCSSERPLIYLFIYLFYNLTAIAIIIAAVNARLCILFIFLFKSSTSMAISRRS